LLNRSGSRGEAQTIRIGYSLSKDPVVERLHRLLTEELLRDVQPVTNRHLKRLFVDLSRFYNSLAVLGRSSGAAPVAGCNKQPSGQPPRPLQDTETTGAPERGGAACSPAAESLNLTVKPDS
jgi:hypothetical protein